MSSKRVVYDVEPRDGGDWAAQRRGTSRATAVTEKKSDAIEEARRLAKQHPEGQVVIHDAEGKIEKEYTYKNDPERHPG